MTTVRISLLPGDHFVIEEDIPASVLLQDIPNADTYNPRTVPPYKLIIASNDTTVVNIHVKTGQSFNLFFPPNFEMENVNFDFLDSVIDRTEDPGNCRTTRTKC